MTNEEIVEEARQVKEQNWREEEREVLHARINLNTGETWEAGMLASELIEKQIEDVAQLAANIAEAHRQGQMGAWGKGIDAYCALLIEIIQNQQAQIVELNAAIDGLNSFVARQGGDMSEDWPRRVR